MGRGGVGGKVTVRVARAEKGGEVTSKCGKEWGRSERRGEEVSRGGGGGPRTSLHFPLQLEGRLHLRPPLLQSSLNCLPLLQGCPRRQLLSAYRGGAAGATHNWRG